jgi:hypothetical protein
MGYLHENRKTFIRNKEASWNIKWMSAEKMLFLGQCKRTFASQVLPDRP